MENFYGQSEYKNITEVNCKLMTVRYSVLHDPSKILDECNNK